MSSAKLRPWEYLSTDITDLSSLSLVEDIIREKMFHHYDLELPYITKQVCLSSIFSLSLSPPPPPPPPQGQPLYVVHVHLYAPCPKMCPLFNNLVGRATFLLISYILLDKIWPISHSVLLQCCKAELYIYIKYCSTVALSTFEASIQFVLWFCLIVFEPPCRLFSNSWSHGDIMALSPPSPLSQCFQVVYTH